MGFSLKKAKKGLKKTFKVVKVGLSTVKAPITTQLKATTYLAKKAGIKPASKLDARLKKTLKEDIRQAKQSLSVIPAAGAGFLAGGPLGAVAAGVAGHVGIVAAEEAAKEVEAEAAKQVGVTPGPKITEASRSEQGGIFDWIIDWIEDLTGGKK